MLLCINDDHKKSIIFRKCDFLDERADGSRKEKSAWLPCACIGFGDVAVRSDNSCEKARIAHVVYENTTHSSLHKASASSLESH